MEIRSLKLPSVLQRLSSLTVMDCLSLKVIESKAPNLSNFYVRGHWVDFSLVETLQMRKLDIGQQNFIRDARAKLPSIMPNIETLVIGSRWEVCIIYKIGCCRIVIYMDYVSHPGVQCYLILNILCAGG
jgi:hypothetical protein